MSIVSKIQSKIVLLFTNPKHFLKVCKDIIKYHFFHKKPEGGYRFSTSSEVVALQRYAQKSTVGIVEIGVLDGGTTKEIAKFASVPMYGIDPIIPDSMGKKIVGSEENILKNMAFYPQYKFFKEYSFNVAKNWQYPFDFIWIDGDHTYEAVRQDYEDWLPLITQGGIIAFHDSAPVTSGGTFAGWPGPVQLVAELKSDPRVTYIETVDTITTFKKV